MSSSVCSKLAVAAALAAGALLVGVPAAQASQSGKQLFDNKCAACHKKSGAGGVHFGDAVSADLRAPGLEDMYHHKDKLILRAILQGMDEDGQPLDAPMPHWKGAISKAQAEKIVSYLKTLKGNTKGEHNEPGEKSEK